MHALLAPTRMVASLTAQVAACARWCGSAAAGMMDGRIFLGSGPSALSFLCFLFLLIQRVRPFSLQSCVFRVYFTKTDIFSFSRAWRRQVRNSTEGPTTQQTDLLKKTKANKRGRIGRYIHTRLGEPCVIWGN